MEDKRAVVNFYRPQNVTNEVLVWLGKGMERKLQYVPRLPLHVANSFDELKIVSSFPWVTMGIILICISAVYQDGVVIEDSEWLSL